MCPCPSLPGYTESELSSSHLSLSSLIISPCLFFYFPPEKKLYSLLISSPFFFDSCLCSLTMSAVADFVDDQLTNGANDLVIQDQGKMKVVMEREKECQTTIEDRDGVCAICLDRIVLQEIALVKGCEHAYCATCILRWASYNEHPKCPQCKHPFESLNVHRSLDGSIRDYMFEESVCLLLRATWFEPLIVAHKDDLDDELDDFYPYEYEDEDDGMDEAYFNNSSSLRIGNRRWGDNGYVRSGRQEARPIYRSDPQDSGAGSSHEPRKKEVSKEIVGRRAKRALRREAADKAAAAKHQQHLVRFGRK